MRTICLIYDAVRWVRPMWVPENEGWEGGSGRMLLRWHHLNSIRPTIKFIMEVEEGESLPSLDTRITRKEDGKLDVIVYRKQTHTDRYRYLHFRSHDPTHVKRGTVRRLYDRARCITQQGQNLKEENHLMKALSWGIVILAPSSVLPLHQGSTTGKGRRRGHPFSTFLT